MADNSYDDPRVYFAAERTFLAWIRTGLALMGFGFVVARFGLFLREAAAAHDISAVHTTGFSLSVGILMIAGGVVLNAAAAWRHLRVISELQNGGSSFRKPSAMGIGLAVVLAVAGLAMVAHLMVLN